MTRTTGLFSLYFGVLMLRLHDLQLIYVFSYLNAEDGENCVSVMDRGVRSGLALHRDAFALWLSPHEATGDSTAPAKIARSGYARRTDQLFRPLFTEEKNRDSMCWICKEEAVQWSSHKPSYYIRTQKAAYCIPYTIETSPQG